MLNLDVDFIFIHQESNAPDQEHVSNRKKEGGIFRFQPAGKSLCINYILQITISNGNEWNEGDDNSRTDVQDEWIAAKGLEEVGPFWKFGNLNYKNQNW